MATNPTHWRRILNDYFVFSKGQRQAVIVLLVAIFLAIFVPAIYRFFFIPVTEKADHVTIEQVASLQVDRSAPANRRDDEQLPAQNNDNNTATALFPFDPNTATNEQWRKLGLKDKTIQTIRNYVSKGGHFYKPDDLRKIYGLHENEVAKLLPYVRIKGKTIDKQVSFPTAGKPKPIDINLADTSAFVALSGIGSKLAARIVNFRERLGGFYTIEQVAETYGLPDSTFQKIRPLLFVSSPALRKRKINTASVEELKSPYIPFNVANAIVQYRLHNGNFKSLEDLKKIPIIDDALYVKIVPYLSAD